MAARSFAAATVESLPMEDGTVRVQIVVGPTEAGRLVVHLNSAEALQWALDLEEAAHSALIAGRMLPGEG